MTEKLEGDIIFLKIRKQQKGDVREQNVIRIWNDDVLNGELNTELQMKQDRKQIALYK